MSVQEWLADTSPAPSRDSARLRGPSGESGRTAIIYRPEPVEVELVRNSKYPFHSLEPGDFFLWPYNGEEVAAVVNRLTSAGHYYCRMWRPDCTVRTMAGKEAVQVMLWEGP